MLLLLLCRKLLRGYCANLFVIILLAVAKYSIKMPPPLLKGKLIFFLAPLSCISITSAAEPKPIKLGFKFSSFSSRGKTWFQLSFHFSPVQRFNMVLNVEIFSSRGLTWFQFFNFSPPEVKLGFKLVFIFLLSRGQLEARAILS